MNTETAENNDTRNLGEQAEQEFRLMRLRTTTENLQKAKGNKISNHKEHKGNDTENDFVTLGH